MYLKRRLHFWSLLAIFSDFKEANWERVILHFKCPFPWLLFFRHYAVWTHFNKSEEFAMDYGEKSSTFLWTVLVCLGWHNKIPQTGWHCLNLFSPSSRGQKCQIKVLQGHSLARAHILTCRWPPSYCVLTWQNGKERWKKMLSNISS